MSRSYTYLLSPQAPPWRVEGLIYLLYFIRSKYQTTVKVAASLKYTDVSEVRTASIIRAMNQ
jgi:hypothetical protein